MMVVYCFFAIFTIQNFHHSLYKNIKKNNNRGVMQIKEFSIDFNDFYLYFVFPRALVSVTTFFNVR